MMEAHRFLFVAAELTGALSPAILPALEQTTTAAAPRYLVEAR